MEREEQARRAWHTAGRTGDPPPRLMTDDELPEWLKVDVAEALAAEKEAKMHSYGRGHRERTALNVYDDMPDDQWLQVRACSLSQRLTA